MDAIYVVSFDDAVEYNEELGYFSTREAAVAALPVLLSNKHLSLTDAVGDIDLQPTVTIYSVALNEPANYNYEGHWFVKLKEG